MKILQLDVDDLVYELVKPESAIHEESKEKRVEIKDALALFVSVEEGDTDTTAEIAVAAAVEFMKKQGRKCLVIYPFAHLSGNLAKPKEAMAVIQHMIDSAPKDIEVQHAPFGWNKKLSVSVKGHPLAEQSKSYGPEQKGAAGSEAKPAAKKEEEVSQSLKEEETKLKSSWYILEPDGKLTEADKFDFKGHENLQKFANYEIRKVRAYQQVPEHVKLMRKLELVDYEPGSDAGNMRYYPNGRLIKKLLENYVTMRAIDYGAIEVETPLMYDYEHPAFKDYLARFPARHYVIKSDDKEYFLRFSACFGQFLIMHDSTLSYRQLPFRVYEITRYSFRREKSGELTGLKRLRAFTMPDMHTICNDLAGAREEFGNQFSFCQSVLSDIGIASEDYEAAIRFTEDFWAGNKDFVVSIVKDRMKKPTLIEMWNYRYAYFDPKFEFNVVDTMDKATALSTVQIDHENSKRYGIYYTSSEGKKENTIILHCSPSGAVERVMYALLELAAIKQRKGEVPSLPLWLSPTQVRVLPLSSKHNDACLGCANGLIKRSVRADVDDSDETLDKKIRNAEQEWVPYIVVMGDREAKSGMLSVRTRGRKDQRNMSADELVKEITDKVAYMPVEKSSLPVLLSKRPIFVG